MVGPMDFTLNEESGIVVEGHDREPLARNPWHPPYYQARVEGAGERVTARGVLPPWWCGGVRPSVAVATADAYRRLDAARASAHHAATSRPRSASASLAAVDALQRADLSALHAALTNDFHDVILAEYPAVSEAARIFTAAGAPRVLLSGSGSCLFALFEGEESAREVGARLATQVSAAFVVPLHRDGAWR